MAQVGQKSETWKQKRANMRASVSLRVRVRVCACASACACARAQPNGDADRRGPRRGRERTPQPCVRRRQSRSPRPRPRRRPHRDRHGQGHPPRGTPVTAGGEHRRARRCSPSGGGGWKCRQLAPRHVMTPRSRATHSLPPSPPRPWVAVSREAARGGALPADLIPYDVTSGHSRLAFCTNSHSADQAIIRRCAFAPCL